MSLVHASPRWCATHGKVLGMEWYDGACRAAVGRFTEHTCESATVTKNLCLQHLGKSRDGRKRACQRGARTPSPHDPKRMFDVHIGTVSPWDRQAPQLDVQQQCCELCAGMEHCTSWLALQHGGNRDPGPLGSAAQCSLYGDGVDAAIAARNVPQIPGASAPLASAGEGTSGVQGDHGLPVLLLRSDTQKLSSVTRCHAAYIRWLKGQVAGEASLQLVVDVSSLVHHHDSARDSPSVMEATGQAAAKLRSALSVDVFAYTVEQVHGAFPAVRYWPSPVSHRKARSRLPGDVIDGWWAKVLRKYKPLLGPAVAERLTSYLIHEPSLVLWARAQRASGGALPSHVWVVEDDTVFTGDLASFLRSYRQPGRQHPSAQRQPDLVNAFANLEGQIEASSHDWKRNDAFLGAFSNRRVHKWEHVERYSLALLDRLDDLMTLGGVAAHGEMFSSTVCAAESWCKTSELRLSGTVSMDASLYALSTSVFSKADRKEREALLRQQRAKGAPGIWLHAIKNYCNALYLATNGTTRVQMDDLGFEVATLELATSLSRSRHQELPLRCELQEELGHGAGAAEEHPVYHEFLTTMADDPLTMDLPFSGSPYCRSSGLE